MDRFALTTIGEAVRGAVLGRGYPPDTCILTTLALCDFITNFGVPARPLTVGASLFNQPFAVRVLREGWPDSTDVLARWYAEDGSHNIGIGYHHLAGTPTTGNAWDGHLVAVVRECWLVDASLDQASRPDKGIVAGVVVAPVDEAFLAGQRTLALGLTAGGALYEPRPDDHSWQRSSDYHHTTKRREIVALATRLILGR